MQRRTRFHLALASLLLTGFIAVAAPTIAGTTSPLDTAQDRSTDDERIAKVKAAYLLNFLKFTNWPTNAFGSEFSPITVTIVGDDPLNAIADATFREKKIHSRSVTIERIAIPDTLPAEPSDNADIEVCAFVDVLHRAHLIYLAPMSEKDTRRVLAHIKNDHVLIVGDTVTQAMSGCHLAFMIEERRLVFCANLVALEKSPLKLSSKLLQLAQPLPES